MEDDGVASVSSYSASALPVAVAAKDPDGIWWQHGEGRAAAS